MRVTPSDATVASMRQTKKTPVSDSPPARQTAAAPTNSERPPFTHEERRQVFAGSDVPLTPERNPREHPWPDDYLNELTKAVRITISFDDLPTCAKQIRMLSTAAGHARTVLYDVERSQQRKRLNLRFIMKQAATEIAELERLRLPARRAAGMTRFERRRKPEA